MCVCEREEVSGRGCALGPALSDLAPLGKKLTQLSHTSSQLDLHRDLVGTEMC